METRASYVLIGAFTLAGILGMLGFFIWLANMQLDRQYADYDILFDNVSGLGTASDVRFNGVSVGQVTAIALYELDPSKVAVRIQIDADTPIKEDTTARLRPQGVTGMSFVELTGGDARAARISAKPPATVPVILSQRSVVQTLTDEAPDLLSAAIRTMNHAQSLLSEQNINHVSSILDNLDQASGQLNIALADVSKVTGDISRASAQFGTFTDNLAPLADSLQTTLTSVTATSDSVRTLIDGEGTGLVTDARGTLARTNTTLDSVNALFATEVPAILADIQATAATANRVIDQVGGDVTTASGKLDPLLATATTAFAEANRALQAAEVTLTTATTAFTSANTVINDDVGQAATDISASVTGLAASITKVADDLPAITAQLRATLERADAVVAGIDGVVTTSGPGINRFAQTGLPQYEAFAVEARNLVGSLERLTAQIQQNPARFFLGNTPPDFRR